MSNKDIEFLEADAAPAPPPTPAAAPAKKPAGPPTVEQLAEQAKLSPFLFAAVKAFHRWPKGKVMERSAFDAAVKRVATHRFGY